MAHLTRSDLAARQPLRPHGSVLAVVLIALAMSIFLAAGFWQMQRAHYKDELRAKAELLMHQPPVVLPPTPVKAADIEFRPVQVEGIWLPDKTIFIDNKVVGGALGYHVITPLRIGGSDTAVLVNRGWVKAPVPRGVLPDIPTSSTPLAIAGIARVPSHRFLELSGEVTEGREQRLWQNVTIERFQAWSGLTLQPVMVFQQNDTHDGLQRVPVAPEATGLGADRHRGYAFTWFSLAAVTLILAIAVKLKSKRNG